jgi:integral membrane sensor domain MASE1
LFVFVELNKRLAAGKNIQGMLEGPLAPGQQQRTIASNLARRWAGSIGLAAAVGFTYFLVALLSYGLSLQSEGLAVFWPASGVSSGILIALGPRARWPVVIGVMVAVVADHLIVADPLRVGIAFALSDAAETLIIAGLIQRYFGVEFSLDRPRRSWACSQQR